MAKIIIDKKFSSRREARNWARRAEKTADRLGMLVIRFEPELNGTEGGPYKPFVSIELGHSDNAKYCLLAERWVASELERVR